MEVKKSPKVDLEDKKAIFMQVGLIVSLALILIAFEWKWANVKKNEIALIEEVDAKEDIAPITSQEEIKPPPPPAPPRAADVLNNAQHNVTLDETQPELNTEMGQNADVDNTANTGTTSSVEVEDEDTEDAPVFYIVEEMPEFPGGNNALQKFIAKSIRYPAIAHENGVQGRVYISFVVNPKGIVEQVKVARGIDPNLDKEAVRVIQSLPQWKPGKQRGKPVKVSFTVPINFELP